jgi:hypothetical protein
VLDLLRRLSASEPPALSAEGAAATAVK